MSKKAFRGAAVGEMVASDNKIQHFFTYNRSGFNIFVTTRSVQEAGGSMSVLGRWYADIVPIDCDCK